MGIAPGRNVFLGGRDPQPPGSVFLGNKWPWPALPCPADQGTCTSCRLRLPRVGWGGAQWGAARGQGLLLSPPRAGLPGLPGAAVPVPCLPQALPAPACVDLEGDCPHRSPPLPAGNPSPSLSSTFSTSLSASTGFASGLASRVSYPPPLILMDPHRIICLRSSAFRQRQ